MSVQRAHQTTVNGRMDQLEHDLGTHTSTVRKSKSGRWKTQKGCRSTILRNWFMDNAASASGQQSTSKPNTKQYFNQEDHKQNRFSHSDQSRNEIRPSLPSAWQNSNRHRDKPTISKSGVTREEKETEQLFDFLKEYEKSPGLKRRSKIGMDFAESTSTRL